MSVESHEHCISLCLAVQYVHILQVYKEAAKNYEWKTLKPL